MGNKVPNSHGAVMSSTSMSNSFASMDAQTVKKLDSIKYYFASRTSAYDDIWNICYRLSEEIQEQVLDVFILTFIDHWDKENERYVLLCERCLILMDFDFERLETRQLFIYDYARFNSIRIGPLVYPAITFNYFNHRFKYAIRFQWNSQKPLNYRDYWNPWSKEIPWITLTQHPLALYINDLLNDNNDNKSSSGVFIDDQYFNREYLEQIRRRFSIETFHDKLFEILNSFQTVPLQVPQLDIFTNLRVSKVNHSDQEHLSSIQNMTLDEAVANNVLREICHPNRSVTIVHYSAILCENYFNLPAMLFNATNSGFYRLRLF